MRARGGGGEGAHLGGGHQARVGHRRATAVRAYRGGEGGRGWPYLDTSNFPTSPSQLSEECYIDR
jgi:hypothetical protein